MIGQRLIARYQQSEGKPPAPLATERVEKSTGVALCQDAESVIGPSILSARHTESNGHGTGAPHRRQKLSATEVVKVVGKPSAHLTYPCRKA